MEGMQWDFTETCVLLSEYFELESGYKYYLNESF